jgi:general secretion pathway protein C
MKNIITIVIIAISILCTCTDGAAQPGNASALAEPSVAHLKLKGTLFTETLNPLAVIEHSNNGQVLMYGLGDDVHGLKIIKISRGEIILGLSDRKYTLSFSHGSGWQPGLPEADSKWYNISRQGNTIITDQATVTGAVSRIRDIMKNLKAGPHAEDGKSSGIKITAINQTGILQDIGVQEGDIIKKANGFTLNSPYQLFNAYRNLKDRSEIRVEIIRQGSPLTLTYRIAK